MPLTQAQQNILQLATDNNGIFDPASSPLHGGALNKVITALQNKKRLGKKTNKGYPLFKLKTKNITSTTSPVTTRKGSKTEKLINMLKRKNGATNSQIQKALNWQPHSVRGIISGTLKKKLGLEVLSEKNKSGVLIYKIIN